MLQSKSTETFILRNKILIFVKWFLSSVKNISKEEFCIFPFFPQSTSLNKYLINEFELFTSFLSVEGIGRSCLNLLFPHRLIFPRDVA